MRPTLRNDRKQSVAACSDAGTRDFSASGIRQGWEAGYTDTKHVLEQRPWEGKFAPVARVILHQGEEHLANRCRIELLAVWLTNVRFRGTPDRPRTSEKGAKRTAHSGRVWTARRRQVVSWG
jgi:hypothetical protein